MNEAMKKKQMTSMYGLCNFMENKEATPEQSHDLLNFRHIGQQAYERYVSAKIIGLPSTSFIKHRKRLATFTVTKVQKKKMKMVEHERKISQRYLKHQLAWISERGTENLDLDI